MLKNLKKELILISFGIVLFAVLMNLATVLDVAGHVVKLCMPVIIGFIIAFILNVPMTGIERLTIWATKGKITNLKRGTSQLIYLLITLALVAAVIAIIIIMLIPDLSASIKSLYAIVVEKWPEIMQTLKAYNINVTWLTNAFESFNVEQFITSTVDVASSAIAGIVEFAIGLIIAMYALMSKDDLARQSNKILKAFVSDITATKIRNIAILVNKTYSKFLSGQCVDACVLGILIFITLNIAGVPYADLIGSMTTVCAFIPYIGAFLSFTVGALLVAIVMPHKLILYIAICLIVQFIEGHFIYPQIVGGSVGMKPLWTLIAVIIGGKLMGLFGMIFFIPLMAVIVTLFKDYAERVGNRKDHYISEDIVNSMED